MSSKDIRDMIGRARAAGDKQREAKAEAERVREATIAQRRELEDRADRFLLTSLEKIVAQEVAAGNTRALIFTGNESDTPFALVLRDKFIEAGYRAEAKPATEVSGKIGYGRGDDTENVIRVYLDF
jgi:hypothetical protein